MQLREGKNLVKFKSDAKRAGYTTYRLKLVKYEHDTELANNAAVMTTPVKGRPSVLYVEGSLQLREPSSATYLQARRSRPRTSTSRCAARRGIPSNLEGAREVRPSCWSPTCPRT